MKKISTLLLLSLFPLLFINGCAATKESRDSERLSNQNTSYMVKITNNSKSEISFNYDKIELNNQSRSLTFAWNDLSDGETKLISVRKGGSLKVKYKKDGKETEENIEIKDDKKIDVTNQGLNSTSLNSTEKSGIHF